MFDNAVDRLFTLSAVAPPKLSFRPSVNALIIVFAPSAVLPNSEISNLVSPKRSSSIRNTGIPLSASLFSSSRPKPPDVVLANRSVMAVNEPN